MSYERRARYLSAVGALMRVLSVSYGVTRHMWHFLVVITLIGFLVGCQDPRLDKLEQRITALEQSAKAASTADQERRQNLERCVEFDAENAYWEYVHLNGTKRANDVWYGPQYMWDSARKRKLDRIEECKLLYGK